MPWIARKLRGSNVFVRATPEGAPAGESDGRVEMVYKLDPAAKVYRAAVSNLEPTGEPGGDELLEMEDVGEPIIVYTDGACTGNPGPAGLGAVIMDGDGREELSEYLGAGTNNIAELSAILRALEVLDTDDARARPIRIHTDSSYSIGVLTKNWKAKANQELIAKLRDLAAKFRYLQFVKVKGHSGVPENERADELARQAIETFQLDA